LNRTSDVTKESNCLKGKKKGTDGCNFGGGLVTILQIKKGE